jgi:hypothetical protein
VKVERVYFVCRGCRVGRHGADERLGVSGARTRQAERMLCLAGGSWSFAQASMHLAELSGLKVSANTVRSVCQREASSIETWQASAPAASEKYRQAPGTHEFETDGTCVNTTQGWKEMRVGVFAKRTPGEPASSAQWRTRHVPPPAARVAFAAIEDHETFAARWPVVASRLGIRSNAPLDVWADGARWIWERVDFHFAFARGTLDVFHALQHVSTAAEGIFGEGSQQGHAWQEQARDALLSEGHRGIQRLIDQTRSNAVRAGQRTALTSLADYLRPHAHRLNYAERLATGRPIGSGLIEGACKNYLGRRLKQTGARWLLPNANRMATLGSLIYADQWTDYWTSPNRLHKP